MQTPARKRAEALFAEFTKQVEHTVETLEPARDRPNVPASGPKTLHLPTDSRPVLTNWHNANPVRRTKVANAGRSS